MAILVLNHELRRRGGGAVAIGPAEAVRLMNGGALLVDVRSANQFRDGHIAGARNVPGDQIADGGKGMEKYSGKRVVLYCDSGDAAGAAARTLIRAGAKDVFSLRGGLAAWRQENLPVVKD